MSMKLSPLSEHPHYAPEIAQWYFDEWGDPSSSSIENFVVFMEKRASSKLDIPISFVVHEAETLIGVVELKFREHKNYPEYEHWLGSLYVGQKYRGIGVGSVLIEHVKSYVSDLKLEILYLQCEHDLVSMYEKYGFQKLHRAKYGKFDTIIITI